MTAERQRRTGRTEIPHLAAEMIAIGRTGDQEKLIEALAGNVMRFAMDHPEPE